MSSLKRLFKRNTHNNVFKALAGFGRSVNRLYENRNHDIYSNGELTVLKKLAKFNPLVMIDGGANKGEYSLLINQLCKNTRIYSFEPVNNTFAELCQNVKGKEQIIPIKKGLYKASGSQKINIYKDSAHSSLFDIEKLPYDPIGQQTIELLSGDDFLLERGIDTVDFLKIDIEGAEYDALLGFEQSIQAGKIKAIQFEYGYINITTKKLLLDFYNFFEQNGYTVGKIFPKTVEFRKYEFKHEDFIGPNFIAVKKSETDLISTLKKN